MSANHSAIFLHLVFSTKNRTPFLKDPLLRNEMHAYLGGTSKNLGCPAVIIGGVEDHVHILARLGDTITKSDWVKELKRSSSIWVKQRDPSLHDFYWQSGSGVFSISCTHLNAVKAYISNQEEHHHRVSFKQEYLRLLDLYGIEYDEKYLWD